MNAGNLIAYILYMKNLLFLLLIVGCADVRLDSSVITTHELDAETIDSHYKNVEIECGKDTCQSKKQYCLFSTREFENSAPLTATCIDKPAECRDCSCMRKDAQTKFKGAKNCKGDIHCSQEDSKLIITCVIPASAFEP